jgi:hypothetical protein
VALRRALEVELVALHIEPRWASTDAAGAPAPITLSAECDTKSGSVALRVWASEPRLVLSRFVALRDVDEPARARTLALVISEALGPALAQFREEGGADSAEPPPAAAAPLDEAAAASRPLERRRTSFQRINPYGDEDPHELFTRKNPYGMPHTVRLGTAAQARLSMRDSSVLLGAEVGLSGPVADDLDATMEVSYASSTSWLSALDASVWSLAFGADFVQFDTIGVALGPRLSFGHISVSDVVSFEDVSERTVFTQLGVRSKLEVPFDERLSALFTFGAHRILGVYALTSSYTGLDQGLGGWGISWSLGLGVEP